MKIKTDLPYKKHVLVCVNERTDGSDCCANVHGREIFQELKKWAISSHPDIWITKTGCLGFCNNKGATIVIYPDRKWFLEVSKDNIELIKKEIS